MSKLSDLLLSSGFNDPYFSGSDDERSMQALYDAILEALMSGGVLPDETLKQLLGDRSGRRGAAAARAADPADHGADAGAGLHHARAGSRGRAAAARAGTGGGAIGRARSRRASRSPTRASTFSATARCAICSARSARAASAATTRAISRPASRRRASPKPYEFGDTLNLDRERDAAERRQRRRPQRHAQAGRRDRPGLRGPGGDAGRVSELVRDGASCSTAVTA